MRNIVVLGCLAVSLALSAAVSAAPAQPAPLTFEELSRALDELARRLQGLDIQWPGHVSPLAPWPERPLVTLMLGWRVELGLSAAQVEALERLRSDFQRDAIRRDADIRVAEEDLAMLLRADPVDLGQVEAKVREIERLRAAFRLSRIRVMEQGRAQLMPEQRQRLRSLLATPPFPPRSPAREVAPRTPERL